MKKTIAVLLAAAILQPSFAAGTNSSGGFTLKTSRFGRISNVYQPKGSASAPDVVLIQDLHVNRAVQKNISGLLSVLDQQQWLPEAIAVEGANGPVDLSTLQALPGRDLRKRMTSYLVSQGEMPGAYAYLVGAGRGTAWGVDDRDLYPATVDIFRQSFSGREAALASLRLLASALSIATSQRTLPSSISMLIDQDQALQKLVAGDISRRDLQAVAPAALTSASELDRLTGSSSTAISEAVSAMADFYSLAVLRDEALFKNMMALRAQRHQSTSVLIAGGFHTAGLEKRLQSAGLSYVVITPEVNSLSGVDHRLYVERMLGHHLTAAQAASGRDWAALLAQVPYNTAQMTALGMSWVTSHRHVLNRIALSLGLTGAVGTSSAVDAAVVKVPAMITQTEILTMTPAQETIAVLLLVGAIGYFTYAVTIGRKRGRHRKALALEKNTAEWVASFSSPEDQAVLATLSSEEKTYFSQLHPYFVKQLGLRQVVTFVHALSFFSAEDWFTFKKFVMPFYREQHYDLRDEKVFLNRALLLKMMDDTLVAKTTEEDNGQQYETDLLSSEQKITLQKMRKAVEGDPSLLDGPIPNTSIQLEIQDLYYKITDMEQRLLSRTIRWSRMSRGGKERLKVFVEERTDAHRQLRQLDEQLQDINRRRAEQLPIGAQRQSADEATIQFPLRGSGDLSKLTDKYYVPVRDDLDELDTYLATQREFTESDDAEWAIVFGSDLEAVPLGALARAGHSHHASKMLVIGGTGRYTPAGWGTEAKGFLRIMDIWGDGDWMRPEKKELEKIPLQDSAWTDAHALAAVDYIKEYLKTHPDEVKSGPLKVLFQQAPMMQRRGVEALALAFKNAGIDVKIVCDTPFFRDFEIAPPNWTLAEWRRRMAWDGVREIAKLIGYRKEGRIRADFVVKPQMMENAMRVSEYLLNDLSIPESERARVPAYRTTIQEEMKRVAQAETISSSPWTQATGMPLSIAKGLAVLLYPFRLMQEAAHAAALITMGASPESVSVHFDLMNPRVEVTTPISSTQRGLAALAGPLSHLLFGGVLVIAMAHLAAGLLPVGTILFGLNAIEFLGVAIPYRVTTPQGQMVSSDMQEFVDSVVSRLGTIQSRLSTAERVQRLGFWDSLFGASVLPPLRRNRVALFLVNA